VCHRKKAKELINVFIIPTDINIRRSLNLQEIFKVEVRVGCLASHIPCCNRYPAEIQP